MVNKKRVGLMVAVTLLTGVLLFVDKHGPRYIQIDNSED